MYLRMISKKAKWEENRNKCIGDLSSDIITNCLRTSNDTLSLWYLDDNSEIDEAIIALASNRDLLQKIDYLIIPDEYIKKYSLSLEWENGNSPYERFNNQHWNIVNLNYSKLGVVSEMILDIINSGSGKIERVYEDEVAEKLHVAIRAGNLKMGRLSEKLQEKLVG